MATALSANKRTKRSGNPIEVNWDDVWQSETSGHKEKNAKAQMLISQGFKPAAEVAEMLGISRSAMKIRLVNKGWDVEYASHGPRSHMTIFYRPPQP
jgi:DNA invertase Pin-like site-specific DNA recombinase